MWYVVKRTLLGAFSIGLLFAFFLLAGGLVWLVLNYSLVGWTVGIAFFLGMSYMFGEDWYFSGPDEGPF